MRQRRKESASLPLHKIHKTNKQTKNCYNKNNFLVEFICKWKYMRKSLKKEELSEDKTVNTLSSVQ